MILFPSTLAKEVMLCGFTPVDERMWHTERPLTESASERSIRWHRHGTASAHISAVRLPHLRKQGFERLLETLRLHIVGIPSKAGIPPAPIWRMGIVALAKAAERRVMTIFHAVFRQQRGEVFLIKMGNAARFRHRTNIHQARDPIMRQQRKPFFFRPSRVSDGVELLGRVPIYMHIIPSACVIWISPKAIHIDFSYTAKNARDLSDGVAGQPFLF